MPKMATTRSNSAPGLQSRLEEALVELNRLAESRMYVIVAVGIVSGWVLPGLDRLTGLVPYLFAYMMFATALSISARDIARVAKMPGAVILIIGTLHLVMPLIAVGLGKSFFGGESEIAVGMVLAALVPVGVMSVIWTGLAGGDVPLALTVVALDSLLSPLVLPGTAALFLGNGVEFDAWSLMIGLVWMIVLPTCAGVSLHDLSGGKIGRRLAPINGAASKACMLSIIAINIAAIRGILEKTPVSVGPVLGILPVQVASGFLIGLVGGKLLKWPEPRARTLTFSVGLRNISAGIVIALQYFSPAAAIPVVLVIVFQQPLAAFFQYWFRRR
ncbi:MAG: bile acid:sodium symporter family protein [Acidobacteria bacterium]|nr:MAG: bile acid:sodium symporter family protein [Acidobacteriota bacterium]